MSRRLRRFFTPDSIQKVGDRVHLSPSDTDHLCRILRMKAGDTCLVTSGQGLEAEAVVCAVLGNQAELLIQKILPKQKIPGLCVFIYPAFIQRGKMDELVRQMQELGIQGFFPLETERTIVKMQPEAKAKVVERWEKIVQEAAKQSGSIGMLLCDTPKPLKEILTRIPSGEALVFFHPEASSIQFSDWVSKWNPKNRVHLFFGPEGGFSDKEVAFLKNSGALSVGLGESILKADTAVLGTAAALKFLFSSYR